MKERREEKKQGNSKGRIKKDNFLLRSEDRKKETKYGGNKGRRKI
jgi:hypothetical protein